MIVKTLRWKSAAFSKLLEYIFKGRSAGDAVFYHNILQPDFSGAVKALEDNDRFLKPLPQRKRTRIYHEVIRWHSKESQFLTPEILEAFAKEYIRLRATDSVVVSVAHSKPELHLHFVISGCNLADGQTLTRMDNKRFKAIRQGIERFQRKHYPQLSRSIVYLNKPERKLTRKAGRQERAFQLNKRQQKQNQARAIVHRCLSQAWTLDQFYDLLIEAGLELKSRKNGQITGIIYQNQPMRFDTTLGINLRPLKVREQRLTAQELALLQGKKNTHSRHRSR